ncbi:P-type conjugative transfer protein TrbL [Acidocella facilis]|uniref:P-type conjugative transfer protein TrbL n=1 Tax=Acidocella facilis TaxID=525 RepID=UPI001F43C4FF|nr:P-type conjugative transfer protein TrbL [Acidocella facilis]
MNPGVIDGFLNAFTTYIDSGFGLLHGEVMYLSSTLIAIDITLAGLFWAWGGDDDIMARLIKKTLYIGFFAYIIGNFNYLAGIVFDSFSGLGLKATGSTLSASEFLEPGQFAQIGINAGMPILQAAGKLMGFTAVFNHVVQIIVLMLTWFFVVISFFILAIQLFITLIEFKLTTLAGFVLVPFALFNRTSFLAEKVLGNVVASGVKVLVLAVIVGIGTTLFSQFAVNFGTTQPTIEDALSLLLAALSLLGLGIFGPGIATGLISGAPQLGAGAAVGTALAAGGIGMAGGMGLRAGAGAVASLARAGAGAAGGATSLAGGAAAAYSLGASGQTGSGAIAGGIKGMGKAGASAAAAPFSEMAGKVANNLKGRWSAGAQAARNAGGGGAAPGGAPPSASSTASASTNTSSSPPAWAKSMRRGQNLGNAVSTAANAVRSGDHGGGSTNLNLSEDD